MSLALHHRVLLRLSLLAGPLWLRWHGVIAGTGVQLLGLPLVARAPGSTIAIGDRTTLCSRSAFTALGVARPVILRTLDAAARIEIGAGCGLSGTVICSATRVAIGAECLIGADVMIADTDFHPIGAAGRRHAGAAAAAPVSIGRNVFLGARSIVLKGVTIGDDAVIGAGSVVAGDIPAGVVAAGNPCRVIGPLPQNPPDHGTGTAPRAMV